MPVKVEPDTADFNRDKESGDEESAPSDAQSVPRPTLRTLHQTLVAYLAEEDSDSESEPELMPMTPRGASAASSSRPRVACPTSLESPQGIVTADSS